MDVSYIVAVDKEVKESGSKGKTFYSYGVSPLRLNCIIDKNGIAHPDIHNSDLETKIKEYFNMGKG